MAEEEYLPACAGNFLPKQNAYFRYKLSFQGSLTQLTMDKVFSRKVRLEAVVKMVWGM